jgi:hypothetical protein
MRTAFLCLGLSLFVSAEIFEAPFSGYSFSTIYENRHQPIIPLSLGGLAVVRTDVNKLFIVGNVAGSAASIYEVRVVRDASGRITSLSGPSVPKITAPKAAGSLVYGPAHLHGALLYSIESGSAGIDVGLVPPGGAAPSATFSLVPESNTAIQLVPGFVGGAAFGSGELKLLTNSGRFYSTFYYSDFYQTGSGPFRLGSPELVATLPVSNLGAFVYVKRGAPGFAANAMLVAEIGANRIVAYDVNANGNPLVNTRRVFLTGLIGISGMTADPITADLLISTRRNSSSAIYRISGFGSSTSNILSQCDQNITTSGVHTLTNDLSATEACLGFRDNVNLTLDCGGRTISGGVHLHGVTGFTIRNCNLKHLGIHSVLNVVSSDGGTITGNVLGDLSNPSNTELVFGDVRETVIENNQIAVRVAVAEHSQKLRIRQNQVTSILDTPFLIVSKQGFMNTFDANTIDGKDITQFAFLVRDENNSAITNNVISNVTTGAVEQQGTNVNLTISGNTVVP